MADWTVLLRNRYKRTVTGAVSWTLQDVLVHDLETYRDEVDAVRLGGGRTTLLEGATSNTGVAMTNGFADKQTILTDGWAYGPEDPEFAQDDVLQHVEPRFWQKKDTLLIFWAGPSVVLSATLTTADATVTVADTSDLAVGQVVVGVGITPGTTVLSITSGTVLELSVPASVTGVETLTFSSGPFLYAVPYSEVVDWGIGTPTKAV
jgi:hypothetical protein